MARTISFSGAMVQAIIEGRKTQTRRIVKQQHIKKTGENYKTVCPYGQTGDILLVSGAIRIILEILDVRVERLNDISISDSIAEGVYPPDPVKAFELLWDSLYGAGSWGKNPMVWVIDFRKL